MTIEDDLGVLGRRIVVLSTDVERQRRSDRLVLIPGVIASHTGLLGRCTCATPVYNAPGLSSRRRRAPLRRLPRLASRDSSAVLRLWCSWQSPCSALSSWMFRPSAWSTSVAVPEQRMPPWDTCSHRNPHRRRTRWRILAQSGGNSSRRFDFHQFDSATAIDDPHKLVDHEFSATQLCR